MEQSWIKATEELVVEEGIKRGWYFTATTTSGKILERVGAMATPHNHRNVLNMVKWRYPQSTFESIGINGQGGWTLHIKIRTK